MSSAPDPIPDLDAAPASAPAPRPKQRGVDPLGVDSADPARRRAYTGFVADGRRNGTIGRHLPRLATAAGFTVRAVDGTAVVFDDFAAAEEILGLRRNVDRAIEAGAFDADPGRGWLRPMPSRPVLSPVPLFPPDATLPRCPRSDS